MKSKIKLGISSCLLGNPVRYDGGHKLDPYLKDVLGREVEWVPVCPEVEAGFFVPREPMQLVADGQRIRLIAVETGLDRTDALVRWVESKLTHLEREGLRGFVFKARSPSCGVLDTPLFSVSGELIGTGAGLFAGAVLRRFFALPIEDEERLRDPVRRDGFLARVMR